MANFLHCNKFYKKRVVRVVLPGSSVPFRGDFTKKVVSPVTLTNATDSPVLFRIQTTHPHRYTVIPSKGKLSFENKDPRVAHLRWLLGCLPPKSKMEVAFTCIPFHFEKGEKLKHKFLIMVCWNFIFQVSIPHNAIYSLCSFLF